MPPSVRPRCSGQVWVGHVGSALGMSPEMRRVLLRGVVLPPARAGTSMLPAPQENGTVKKAIAQLTQSLLLSLAARSQLQELREKLRSPAVDKGPILKAKPPASQKDILGVCCDPLVLAQQLTHIELVSAREALGAAGCTDSCLSRAMRAPTAFSMSAPPASLLGGRGVRGGPLPARSLPLADVSTYSRFLCAWPPGLRGTQQPCVKGRGRVARTKVAPGWR